MRKLVISVLVAVAAMRGAAPPALADTVIRLGPGGVYVDPSHRQYRDDYYRRYEREDYRTNPASCRTKKEKVYSNREDRWVRKATRVCYR
jgi:hypothetical protein